MEARDCRLKETVDESQGDYSLRDYTEERDGKYEKRSVHVEKFIHVCFLATLDGPVFSHRAVETSDEENV